MYTIDNPGRFQKGGSLRDSLHGANPGQNYLRKYCSPKRNQVYTVYTVHLLRLNNNKIS